MNAEIETRKRIKLLIAAYAYEFLDNPIMTDEEFDKLALSVDLKISTQRPDLDCWFIMNFNPSTGIWIKNFPELEGIERLYETHYRSSGG